MNEPEQYQPTNTDERQETADAAPVSSSSDAAASSQPEYGQINQPEYGAMSSQLPAGYDPYVYGAPEPEPQPADAVQQQNMQYQTGQYPSNGQQPMPPYNANGQRNPYGANPYGPNPYDPNQYPQQGNMMNQGYHQQGGMMNQGYPLGCLCDHVSRACRADAGAGPSRVGRRDFDVAYQEAPYERVWLGSRRGDHQCVVHLGRDLVGDAWSFRCRPV